MSTLQGTMIAKGQGRVQSLFSAWFLDLSASLTCAFNLQKWIKLHIANRSKLYYKKWLKKKQKG